MPLALRTVEDWWSSPPVPEPQAAHRLESRGMRCAAVCDNYPLARGGLLHKPKGAKARPADKCGVPGECAATRPGACLPRQFCYPFDTRKTYRVADSATRPERPPPPDLLVDIASLVAPCRRL